MYLIRVAVAIVIGLTAIAAGGGKAVAQESKTKITIALSSSGLVVAGLRIAEMSGLFAKHGLDPRFILMDSGNATVTALLSGAADFAATGPTDALAARARGRDIVFVANLYRGYAGAVVVSKSAAERAGVPPGAPLKDRLASLGRMTVAGPSPTAGYTTVLRNVADSNGVALKFVYMAQPAMTAALEAGAIDAMSAGPPFWGVSVSRGTGVLWISADDLPANMVPASSNSLQTTRAYAVAHTEVVSRLRSVLDDVSKLIEGDPTKARAALTKAYTQISQGDLDFAFDQERKRWTAPSFTEADVRQEILLFSAGGGLTVQDISAKEMLLNSP